MIVHHLVPHCFKLDWPKNFCEHITQIFVCANLDQSAQVPVTKGLHPQLSAVDVTKLRPLVAVFRKRDCRRVVDTNVQRLDWTETRFIV